MVILNAVTSVVVSAIQRFEYGILACVGSRRASSGLREGIAEMNREIANLKSKIHLIPLSIQPTVSQTISPTANTTDLYKPKTQNLLEFLPRVWETPSNGGQELKFTITQARQTAGVRGSRPLLQALRPSDSHPFHSPATFQIVSPVETTLCRPWHSNNDRPNNRTSKISSKRGGDSSRSKKNQWHKRQANGQFPVKECFAKIAPLTTCRAPKILSKSLPKPISSSCSILVHVSACKPFSLEKYS